MDNSKWTKITLIVLQIAQKHISIVVNFRPTSQHLLIVVGLTTVEQKNKCTNKQKKL